MTNTGLYQLKRTDIKQITQFLTDCFYNDPLYLELLPEEATRKKVLPGFFECYLDMAFDYCEIYADSPAMNGLITVFDTSAPASRLGYLMDLGFCALRFSALAVRYDTSLKTLLQFARNMKFLSSTWEDDIKECDKVHIDFLAVKPQLQGKGIATRMMSTVLAYADQHHYLTTVETHNQNNVTLYEHYGFHMFRIFSANSRLREYCMVRS